MATSIDKRTTKLMIDRLNKELDDLFIMQESGKRNKGKLKAQRGIKVPGVIPSYVELQAPQPNTFYYPDEAIDTSYLNPSPIDTKTLADVKPSPVPGMNFSDKARNFFFDNKWSPNYWGNNPKTWSGLAQLSPVLSNLGSMLDQNKGLKAKDFYNPNANQVASLMRDRRVNVQPAMEQILNSERIGHYNLRGMARTPGELMGNTSALANQAMRNRAGVMANKQNIDLQMAGEEAQMLQQEGMHRAGVNWNVMDWNKAADAQRRNIFRTGLSQLSQWSQGKELQKNMAMRDEERIMTLKDIFQQMLPFWDTLDKIKTT